MVEYAVILGLVAAALVLVYTLLGTTTAELLDRIVSQL
jgi:Flp pilus assembly pilin Flp